MKYELTRIAKKLAKTASEEEGSVSAPIGQVLGLLQKLVSDKYSLEIAYRNFSDRTRGPWRDALVSHWQEHASDERKMTYDLSMKMVGMGGDPIMTGLQLTACPANVASFCKILMSMELNNIKTARELADISGDNVGLRVLAENVVLLDSHHLDDLRRMCFGLDIKVT